MKTTIEYTLVTCLLGNRANGRDPKVFSSIEDAYTHWEKEYKNRDEKDGHDDYWRKVPFRAQQIITNDLWDTETETLVTVVKKRKSILMIWWENCRNKIRVKNEKIQI